MHRTSRSLFAARFAALRAARFAALLAASLALTAPSAARADEGLAYDPGAVMALSVAGAAVFVGLDAVVIIAMLDAAAHAHLSSEPWAVLSGVTGAVHMGLGIAQLVFATRDAQALDGGGVAVGSVLLTLGVAFATHATLSLALGQDAALSASPAGLAVTW